MQSFWRNLQGIGSHLSTSKIMHFGSSKVCPASGHPILFTLAPNLSTSARRRTTNIFQQSAGYSKQCEFALPPKCRSWNSLIAENKLPICKEFALSNNGIAKCGFVGNNPPFRCMTTVGHPGPSSGQGSSASSPDIVQPQRIKFKRLDKTAKHIMNILDKEAVEKVQSDREIPDIRPGYIIQLKVEVPENKRRVSILKGIVIARRNAGLNTTFRLRRLVAGVGVESVFPLYSPNIKEMKVLDKKKVRRAKLYYLRDRMNALKK